MKKILSILLLLSLCFAFAGCDEVDIYEIENENGEVIYKIRSTSAEDGFYSSKIELLDLQDNVIHTYEASEDTLLSYANITYTANRFPFMLSERTFEHYGFEINRNFYISISEVDKESKQTVYEEILSSEPYLKVLERHYFSEASNKDLGTKRDKIELFLPDGRLFISCELSPENIGNGSAMLGGIGAAVNSNYEEEDYYVCHEHVDGPVYKTYYFDLFTGEPIDKPQDVE
ncbi:MAG: hypothetical protein J6M35_08030 [Clostridia bacterium]|nr:hypothetical protein [Clostridia bacterium]